MNFFWFTRAKTPTVGARDLVYGPQRVGDQGVQGIFPSRYYTAQQPAGVVAQSISYDGLIGVTTGSYDTVPVLDNRSIISSRS